MLVVWNGVDFLTGHGIQARSFSLEIKKVPTNRTPLSLASWTHPAPVPCPEGQDFHSTCTAKLRRIFAMKLHWV